MDLMKIDVMPEAVQMATAADIINKVIDGEVNPLHLDVWLKSIENTITFIRKNVQVKDCILNEAEKYQKTFQAYGAKIQLKRVKKWDYSPCNDTMLEEYQEQQDALKEMINKRKKTLQAIADTDMELFDHETGELISAPTFIEPPQLSISFKGVE